MPFGRSGDEKKWFRGWYEVVIKPAVKEAGYEPIMAVVEEHPEAIGDGTRAHLAFDPMVVVDLGSAEPEEPPNPNVMYELGIRHAFGLPLVVMAWEEQDLPFDVAGQRIILEPRDIGAQEKNRVRLVSFIKAAEEGRYYRPMEAVERHATIESTLIDLSERSLVGALAQEIRELRETVSGQRYPPIRRTRKRERKLQMLLTKNVRKPLWAAFTEVGGDPWQWSQILKTPVSANDYKRMRKWDTDEWLEYLTGEAVDFGLISEGERLEMLPRVGSDIEALQAPDSDADADLEALLTAVREAMPPQPWPKGAHRVVAKRLGVTGAKVHSAIQELIRTEVFKPQIDGVLYVRAPLDEEDGNGT